MDADWSAGNRPDPCMPPVKRIVTGDYESTSAELFWSLYSAQHPKKQLLAGFRLPVYFFQKNKGETNLKAKHFPLQQSKAHVHSSYKFNFLSCHKTTTRAQDNSDLLTSKDQGNTFNQLYEHPFICCMLTKLFLFFKKKIDKINSHVNNVIRRLLSITTKITNQTLISTHIFTVKFDIFIITYRS